MKIYDLIFPLNIKICCDMFGVGSAIGGAASAAATIGAASINAAAQDRTNDANKEMVEQTNQTNKDIAHETNATNAANTTATNEANLQIHREDNAFNAAEAEKSRQWNSEQAIMERRREAGINPLTGDFSSSSNAQASAGTPPTMQSPEVVTPTMQASQAVAPQVDEAAIGNSVGAIATNVATVAKLQSEAKKNKEDAKLSAAQALNWKILNEFSTNQCAALFEQKTLENDNLRKQGHLFDEQIKTEQQNRQHIYFATQKIYQDFKTDMVGLYMQMCNAQHNLNQDAISIADQQLRATESYQYLDYLGKQFSANLGYQSLVDNYRYGAKSKVSSTNFQFNENHNSLSGGMSGNFNGSGRSSTGGSPGGIGGFSKSGIGRFFGMTGGIGLDLGMSQSKTQGGLAETEHFLGNWKLQQDFKKYLGSLYYLSHNPDPRGKHYWNAIKNVKTTYPTFQFMKQLYNAAGTQIFQTTGNAMSDIERY